MPDLAQRMDAEGQFQVEDDAANALEEANYMLVETAGPRDHRRLLRARLLYAGLARFEFQGVLRRIDFDANLVFLRDCQRAAFFVTPTDRPAATPSTKTLSTAYRSPRAAHNIASAPPSAEPPPSSSNRSPFPHHQLWRSFELDVYTRPRRLMTSIFDFKKFFTEPAAYWEMLLVTSAAIWGVRHLSVARNSTPSPISPAPTARGRSPAHLRLLRRDRLARRRAGAIPLTSPKSPSTAPPDATYPVFSRKRRFESTMAAKSPATTTPKNTAQASHQ